MLDILKLAIVLLVISAIAAFAIALTNKNTEDKIELQKIQAEKQALNTVFPDGVTIIKVEDTASLPGPYWLAQKNDSTIGYAFIGSSRGYSSDIEFLVGVDLQGAILGLTILSQSETPGLGTRVEEIVSKLYFWNGLFTKKTKDAPWFTKQFRGIDVTKDIGISKTSEWHAVSDNARKKLIEDNTVTAITGATISTRAVCTGIKKNAYTYLSVLKVKQDTMSQEQSPSASSVPAL